MGNGPFTRYFCPLECGWHYDINDPNPGEGLSVPIAQSPNESFQDLVTRVAGEAARAHLKQVDDVLNEHLSTHTVLQAAAKAAEFRQERDQARAEKSSLLELVDDLRDPDPCWYDHHGYCQAHGWTATDPRCPDARAAELFAGCATGK
ncbi:hypothetical protein [Streptomyces caniscabiei]|uniref:hypothetical protein n=1 Tax=Streptomyces caniscabiei TaxID=2746961 RepID=UPI001872B9F8|nr:hypothetical protein [Streptomyces caniscabiei]MBE4761765.1 hypothetical protein [Streptomyces caniscabiei]MDX2948007.1 hypothetical protein [Streptomyces caniscabiei]MDX2986475.1 hypothetical protein [Streptomyces caniscabiei]